MRAISIGLFMLMLVTVATGQNASQQYEAVRESFASAKTRDEQLLAEARYSAIESALASLQGEDAVERVAKIIDPQAFNIDPPFQKDSYGKASRRDHARTKARAILATGLMILAALCFFTGLLLDTVVRGRREVMRLHYLALPGVAGER